MRPFSGEIVRHISSLRRYAIALTGDQTYADDLVQETLERAIVYVHSDHDIRNMRSYLFSILHNVRTTHLRRFANGFEHVSFEEPGFELVYAPRQLEWAEASALIDALGELPEDQRQVVLLICIEGFSYKEAATIMGVPIGTIMSRLFRARGTLVRCLSSDPNSDTENSHK